MEGARRECAGVGVGGCARAARRRRLNATLGCHARARLPASRPLLRPRQRRGGRRQALGNASKQAGGQAGRQAGSGGLPNFVDGKAEGCYTAAGAGGAAGCMQCMPAPGTCAARVLVIGRGRNRCEWAWSSRLSAKRRPQQPLWASFINRRATGHTHTSKGVEWQKHAYQHAVPLARSDLPELPATPPLRSFCFFASVAAIPALPPLPPGLLASRHHSFPLRCWTPPRRMHGLTRKLRTGYPIRSFLDRHPNSPPAPGACCSTCRSSQLARRQQCLQPGSAAAGSGESAAPQRAL